MILKDLSLRVDNLEALDTSNAVTVVPQVLTDTQKKHVMTTTVLFDLKKVYNVYHFAGPWSKPFYKFNKDFSASFENNFIVPVRNFYSNLFKLFGVDVDFNYKPTKFTTSAVAINRCYNTRLRNIKSNYKRALKK